MEPDVFEDSRKPPLGHLPSRFGNQEPVLFQELVPFFAYAKGTLCAKYSMKLFIWVTIPIYVVGTDAT